MKILALDTTSNAASCALLDQTTLIGLNIQNFKKTHSQRIMPMIDGMLAGLETDINQVDLFAV